MNNIKKNIKNNLKNNIKIHIKNKTTYNLYTRNTIYNILFFYNKKTFLIATLFPLWTLSACATHMPHTLHCSATANGQT